MSVAGALYWVSEMLLAIVGAGPAITARKAADKTTRNLMLSRVLGIDTIC